MKGKGELSAVEWNFSDNEGKPRRVIEGLHVALCLFSSRKGSDSFTLFAVVDKLTEGHVNRHEKVGGSRALEGGKLLLLEDGSIKLSLGCLKLAACSFYGCGVHGANGTPSSLSVQ